MQKFGTRIKILSPDVKIHGIDHEFNVYKTCESYFETVTCCSGCLAGYRREAIESVMSIWNSENKYSNNRNRT